MPKVWIINRTPKLDLSAAEPFGELHDVLVGHAPHDPGKFLEILHTAWREGGAETGDFLLPIGSLPLNMLAGAAWVTIFDDLQILVWNGTGYEVLQTDEIDLIFSYDQPRRVVD